MKVGRYIGSNNSIQISKIWTHSVGYWCRIVERYDPCKLVSKCMGWAVLIKLILGLSKNFNNWMKCKKQIILVKNMLLKTLLNRTDIDFVRNLTDNSCFPYSNKENNIKKTLKCKSKNISLFMIFITIKILL